MEPLLQVTDLSIGFQQSKQVNQAVEGVNFFVGKGEIVGLVGESGCGKSLTSMAIMGLLRRNKSVIQTGEITFAGEDLAQVSEKNYRRIRGGKISMIFQEPLTSLNPVFTVGNQIMEVLRLHESLDKKIAFDRAVELLQTVKIPEPAKRMLEYPHQLSGGMRQRVMIAMSLAGQPDLLIADEPTTALDVTIQAQILDLLLSIRKKTGMGILFITHDLGVVAEVCDTVYVMYGGRVVEKGRVTDVLFDPQHPYTRGLIKAMPHVGARKTKLQPIQGHVPTLGDFPKGCRFRDRCEHAFAQCENKPELSHGTDHQYACWLGRG